MEEIDLARLSLPDNVLRFVEKNLRCQVMMSMANAEQDVLNADTYFLLGYLKSTKQVFFLDVICFFDNTISFKQY